MCRTSDLALGWWLSDRCFGWRWNWPGDVGLMVQAWGLTGSIPDYRSHRTTATREVNPNDLQTVLTNEGSKPTRVPERPIYALANSDSRADTWSRALQIRSLWPWIRAQADSLTGQRIRTQGVQALM